jgi:hypothetical protein
MKTLIDGIRSMRVQMGATEKSAAAGTKWLSAAVLKSLYERTERELAKTLEYRRANPRSEV